MIMKRITNNRLSICVLVFVMFICWSLTAKAQSYYDDEEIGAYHQDTEFIIHAGVLQSKLRYGEVVSGVLGIDYTPWSSEGEVFSYTFNMEFVKSEKHWTVNPLGAFGIIMSLFCKNIIKDDETT